MRKLISLFVLLIVTQFVFSQNVTILFNPMPCRGDSVVLSATGGQQYLWINSGQIDSTITVYPTADSWYVVSIDTILDSVFVDVMATPSVSFNIPTDICNGAIPLDLDSCAVVLGGTSSWYYAPGGGVTNRVFYPSTVAIGGTYTIDVYSINVSTGCVDSARDIITVRAAPTLNFNLPIGAMCNNAQPFIISGAIPTGGYYTGPGVDTNGVFYPNLANSGVNQISYSYTDIYGCNAVISKNIIINVPVLAQLSIPATNLCDGHAPININVSPIGGSCVHNGLNLLQIDSNTFRFNPSGLSGIQEVVYSLPSSLCGDSDTAYVEIHTTPLAIINGPTNMQITDLPIQLICSPLGGELRIDGLISGSFFDPSIFGIGSHMVTYEFNTGFCSDTDTLFIYVGNPTGMDIVNGLSTITTYPNPVNDVLNIKMGDVDVSEIQIVNYLGQVIYQNSIEATAISLDVASFVTGIYFIRFTNNGQFVGYKKFIKQ